MRGGENLGGCCALESFTYESQHAWHLGMDDGLPNHRMVSCSSWRRREKRTA